MRLARGPDDVRHGERSLALAGWAVNIPRGPFHGPLIALALEPGKGEAKGSKPDRLNQHMQAAELDARQSRISSARLR
jgi:hypothetical protein